MSLFTQNRTVLLVSDDALYIYKASSKGPQLVEAVPWEAERFEESVASIIAKDCGRKPVLILNDMVEQFYRKERLVRTGVGMLDKTTMLKRKLHVAFPNHPIRAAMPLKEKVQKADGQPAADVYIFAAIADTQHFRKTMAAVRKSLASVAGFCLLPVESSDMVGALAAKLTRQKNQQPVWSVFIGQHRNGSLRQIVTKNGELALTRMSPIVEDDSDPARWANEVYQEFKATMSYLSRFGYGEEDGLRVTAIADTAAGDILEGLFEEDCAFDALTLSEAAKILNLPVGYQDDQRHADILHVAWAGRKSRLILPMKAVQVDEVSRPRQAAVLVSLLLFLGAAFLGYQIMGQSQELLGIRAELKDMRDKKIQLDSQYQAEVQRKEELGFDVRLVQSSIAVHEELEAGNIDILALFKGVGEALGKDLRLDEISVSYPKKTTVSNVIGQMAKPGAAAPLYEARLKMTYPGTTDVEKGNNEVRALRDRLSKILPGHEVAVTKYLKDYEYTEGIIVETGDLNTQGVSQDFVAEILIKGPEGRS
ncbi:MAG: hypothetical protein KDJ75_09185 [Alphaproteobacteria bacterium]|nr:hypothetical protein [Alphaproteobacteria bacterium]